MATYLITVQYNNTVTFQVTADDEITAKSLAGSPLTNPESVLQIDSTSARSVTAQLQSS